MCAIPCVCATECLCLICYFTWAIMYAWWRCSVPLARTTNNAYAIWLFLVNEPNQIKSAQLATEHLTVLTGKNNSWYMEYSVWQRIFAVVLCCRECHMPKWRLCITFWRLNNDECGQIRLISIRFNSQFVESPILMDSLKLSLLMDSTRLRDSIKLKRFIWFDRCATQNRFNS